MHDKIAFEERKKKEGVPYITSKFDKQEKRLDTIMSILLLRRKKDNEYNQKQTQVNSSISENKTKEEQEWEMIKEKYDYDELEPERKQIIEQEFREMIYKRKMDEFGVDDDDFDEFEKSDETIENIEYTGRKIM